MTTESLQTVLPFLRARESMLQVKHTAHRHGIEAGPPSQQQNLIYPSFSISNAFPLGALRLWEDSDLDHFHCFSIGYLRAGVLLFSSSHATRAASYIHSIPLSTLSRPHSNQLFDSTYPGHLLVTFATVPTPLSCAEEEFFCICCSLLFGKELAVYE